MSLVVVSLRTAWFDLSLNLLKRPLQDRLAPVPNVFSPLINNPSLECWKFEFLEVATYSFPTAVASFLYAEMLTFLDNQ